MVTEDKMVGCHHRLNGHEYEQSPRDSEGQGSLVYCSPWDCKDSEIAEKLNNSSSHQMSLFCLLSQNQ